MPGMGLPEGPADQEPTPGASGAGFAPWGRPFARPVGAVPPGAPLLLLEIFGHLVDVLGAGLLRAHLCAGPVCCDSPWGLPQLSYGPRPPVPGLCGFMEQPLTHPRSQRIASTRPNRASLVSPSSYHDASSPLPNQPHGMRTTFKFPKHEERPTGNNIRTPAAACGTRYIPKRPSRLTNKGGLPRDLRVWRHGGADSYLDSGLRRQPQPPPAVVYRIVDGPAALPEGL